MANGAIHQGGEGGRVAPWLRPGSWPCSSGGCVLHGAPLRAGEGPTGGSPRCAVPQHEGCCCCSSVAGWTARWPAWLGGRELG